MAGRNPAKTRAFLKYAAYNSQHFWRNMTDITEVSDKVNFEFKVAGHARTS